MLSARPHAAMDVDEEGNGKEAAEDAGADQTQAAAELRSAPLLRR